MNCFEARNQFAAFWRREMQLDARAALAAHLRECGRCDHSFRAFALSAPVLHSAMEPERSVAARRTGGLHTVAMPAQRDASAIRPRAVVIDRWRGVGMGFAMAALALLAIYVSTAPHDTFEDAFAGDSDSQAETVTYTPPVNLFGQQIMGRESGIQDPLLQEEGPASPQNDLAG